MKIHRSQVEPLLSETEAAEVLGLSDRKNPKGSLRWLMRTGRLAYVRLARGVYGFRREDVAACIEASRVPAGAGQKNTG